MGGAVLFGSKESLLSSRTFSLSISRHRFIHFYSLPEIVSFFSFSLYLFESSLNNRTAFISMISFLVLLLNLFFISIRTSLLNHTSSQINFSVTYIFLNWLISSCRFWYVGANFYVTFLKLQWWDRSPAPKSIKLLWCTTRRPYEIKVKGHSLVRSLIRCTLLALLARSLIICTMYMGMRRMAKNDSQWWQSS